MLDTALDQQDSLSDLDERVREARDRIDAIADRTVRYTDHERTEWYHAFRPRTYVRPDRTARDRFWGDTVPAIAFVVSAICLIAAVAVHPIALFGVPAGPVALWGTGPASRRATFRPKYELTASYLRAFEGSLRTARKAGKRNAVAAQISAELHKLSVGVVELAIAHDLALAMFLRRDRYTDRPSGLVSSRQLMERQRAAEEQLVDVLVRVLVAQWAAQDHADGTWSAPGSPAAVEATTNLSEQMRATLDRLADLCQ